ncbi:MAG: sigma-70 family RNA polymerase sigma factor [Acidobacteria bacterium]|nr:sigma-70 family RNA polymerase sigma factor [Acidobacteriota bacterium]
MLQSAAMAVEPRLPTSDEASLIRAAQRGDADAFERLVRGHDQGVLRLALNLLRSREDARDAYQESLLRVFRGIGSFRFDCAFQTWLYRIATNVCLDFLRRRRARPEEPAEIQSECGAGGLLDRLETPSAGADPERSAWNRELGLRIEAALGELTPRERMVFELRHYQGLRLRNIGEILGTSEEAAKNCLFRATRKLRAALGEHL